MIKHREHTEVRQKQIVSAARKLIVRYGSEHVTVRKMAEEIGVSEGAIYRHFRSKKDILSLLIDDINTTLLKDIETGSQAGLGSVESLEKIIISLLSGIEQRKGVSFQVIAEIISLGDKDLNNKLHQVIDNYVNRIKGILLKGASQGLIRSDIDAEASAIMLFSMTQGLVNIWALSHYEFNLLEKFKPIWDLYLGTLQPRPQAVPLR
jgi:AcrR family transcriptional regulator